MSNELLTKLDLRRVDKEGRRDLFYGLGRLYLKLSGRPQEEIDKIYNSLYGYSDNHHFWDPRYMDESGIKPGMDTMDAFRCLVDYKRTSVLVNGIRQTIEAMKTNGKEHIVTIDAGTGTSILAIASLAAGCDQVYALEINPDTVEATRQFIDVLNLSDRIKLIECDATDVDLGDIKADLLISENLSNGIFDEPQYKIIKHLSKYLTPDAKIIPFKSEVYVSLGHSEWEGEVGTNTTAWHLDDLEDLSLKQRCFEVQSIVGLDLTHVSGGAALDTLSTSSKRINTLKISTRFVIDDSVSPSILEADQANFLGQSDAFKLTDQIETGEEVEVIAQYPAGTRKDNLIAEVQGNRIILRAKS